MVSPNVFGYQPQLLPMAQDLEEARRLLAAAGFPDGVDLTLEYRQGRDLEPVGSQLAAAGIRAELVARPWGEMYPRLQSGDVAFYYGGWVCPMGDASDLLDQKVHTRDLARGYGVSNSNRYSNPVLDALIEDGVARLSMVERRAILQRALELLAEDRVFIPLFSAFGLYGLRREIEWTPRQDERINAFDMRR